MKRVQYMGETSVRHVSMAWERGAYLLREIVQTEDTEGNIIETLGQAWHVFFDTQNAEYVGRQGRANERFYLVANWNEKNHSCSRIRV